jgi:hypothetical protein
MCRPVTGTRLDADGNVADQPVPVFEELAPPLSRAEAILEAAGGKRSS